MVKRVNLIKKYILFIGVTLLLSGCGSSDELIEVGSWRDKLITPEEKTVENPLSGVGEQLSETTKDVTDALGNGANNAVSNAQSLGLAITGTIKEWSDGHIEEAMEGLDKVSDGLEEGAGLSLQEIAENAAPGKRFKVSLERVVDGDTIMVNYEKDSFRIRLIGVNTPESVHPDDEKIVEEGKYASDFLKEYLADTENVWLEFDLDVNDDYGRILAYVWLNESGNSIDADMLNGILLKLGWAEAVTINPNVKYEKEFKELAEENS